MLCPTITVAPAYRKGDVTMAKTRDLLILKAPELRAEVSRFFSELNKEPDLRNLFFRNPSLVLRARLQSLSNVDVGAPEDRLANNLLFSALSNDKFMAFLRDYQARKASALERYLQSPEDPQNAKEFDEKTVRGDFANALLEFGDKELLSSILATTSSSAQSAPVPAFFEIFVVVFVVAALFVTVIPFGMDRDLTSAERGNLPISASDLRMIAEQLIAAARQFREAGFDS
jgi:hypothetical protein